MKRLAFAIVLLLPTYAYAQDYGDEDASPGTESMEISGSTRSMSSQWLIMPPGWETTGDLRFITGGGLSLTDEVVSGATVRRSFGGKAEVDAGIDLLPKQPSDTNDSVFQGANIELLYAIGRKSAFHSEIAGGPLLDKGGVWTTGGGGFERRSIVHDTLSFQYGLGGDVLNLAVDDGNHHAILGEVTASLKTMFQIQDAFGLWFSGVMAFPVGHSGALADGMDFDPQTRVDVGAGMVYSLVDNWDVFMEVSVIDRGQADHPETTLPILEGGSDQRVFTFGITRHWGEHDGYAGDYSEIALE
jgi:hypothetical protein